MNPVQFRQGFGGEIREQPPLEHRPAGNLLQDKAMGFVSCHHQTPVGEESWDSPLFLGKASLLKQRRQSVIRNSMKGVFLSMKSQALTSIIYLSSYYKYTWIAFIGY